MPGHVHKQIRSVAQEMCAHAYELLMGHNDIFEAWKKANPDLSPKQLESRFIAKNWSSYVQTARATLAGMLGNPMVDAALKESIMEALMLDNTLMRGRGRVGDGMDIVKETANDGSSIN